MILKNIIIRLLIFLKNLHILRYPKCSLRVLMYHHIPENDYKNFENQIKFLKKKWIFISPKKFYNLINNKKKIKKRYLLLTFDDGFKSNFYLAQKVLTKFNLKSIFFIPSKFIFLKKIKEKRKFIKKNLQINTIDSNMKNMSLADLRWLIKHGHEIGSHTFSHKNLKKIKNKAKLQNEIYNLSLSLAKKLNYKFNSFAFNFGRIKYISKDSLKIAEYFYKYIFLGIRGNNYLNSNLIYRDNILSNEKPENIEIYLMGFFDFLYKKEKSTLLKFLN